MAGVKVKLVVEPGDSAADLKLRYKPGDGPEEERLVSVGTAMKEMQEEYDLELGSTLVIAVEEVRRIKYDPEQFMNVEMTGEETKKEEERNKKRAKEQEEAEKKDKERKKREAVEDDEPKSGRAARESGAKESAHETQEAPHTRAGATQGARSTADLPDRPSKGETPKR